MDHGRLEGEALAAGLGGGLVGEHAGRADDHVLGDVEVDLVVAEVGVELAEEGEGVGAPALVVEDAELGVPLGDHVEVALVAGAGEHPREAGEEVELHGDRLPGGDGAREGEGGEAGLGVLGPGEQGRRGGAGLELGEAARGALAEESGGAEVDVAPATLVLVLFGAAVGAARLEHPGGVLGPKGVHIEVEPQDRGRVLGGVPPGDPGGARDGVLLGVEAGVEDVVGDPGVGEVSPLVDGPEGVRRLGDGAGIGGRRGRRITREGERTAECERPQPGQEGVRHDHRTSAIPPEFLGAQGRRCACAFVRV